MINRVRAQVEDWPGRVTILLALLVLLHWQASERWDRVPNPLGAIANRDGISDLYLGMLGFSALLAAFAGIVVVFAMSPESESLRRLREIGGNRIAANWVAPITSSLLSASGAFLATALVLDGRNETAAWLFEFAALAALHGVLRMIWLLRTLVDRVSNEGSTPSDDGVDLASIPASSILDESA